MPGGLKVKLSDYIGIIESRNLRLHKCNMFAVQLSLLASTSGLPIATSWMRVVVQVDPYLCRIRSCSDRRPYYGSMHAWMHVCKEVAIHIPHLQRGTMVGILVVRPFKTGNSGFSGCGPCRAEQELRRTH